MGIGHRAQSESILLQGGPFPPLPFLLRSILFFLMEIFTAQYLERRKGHCRFQESRAGLPLLLQTHDEEGNIFHSCYLQIQQMSFKLFASLSTAWYVPVNVVFSSITVSIVQMPEGSLMNPSCVGWYLEGYRKKKTILKHTRRLQF